MKWFAFNVFIIIIIWNLSSSFSVEKKIYDDKMPLCVVCVWVYFVFFLFHNSVFPLRKMNRKKNHCNNHTSPITFDYLLFFWLSLSVCMKTHATDAMMWRELNKKERRLMWLYLNRRTLICFPSRSHQY